MSQSLKPLSELLQYAFQDESLLATALSHRSVGTNNNERLEYLGDAIIDFVVAAELYRKFPEFREGDLSRLRARLVRGENLAKMAKDLFQLGKFLKLGIGELKSGGAERPSILAGAFEAVVGAIYLDGGYATCEERVLAWFREELATISLDDLKDPKTRLQEFQQARHESLPEYRILSTEGAEHQQVFHVECAIQGRERLKSVGEGSSRRAAEQRAAQELLTRLLKHG